MMRNVAFLLAVVAVLTLAGTAWGDTWQGDESKDWFTLGNWADNTAPTGTDGVAIKNATGDYAEINNAVAVAKNIVIGDATNAGRLDILSAGSLDCGITAGFNNRLENGQLNAVGDLTLKASLYIGVTDGSTTFTFSHSGGDTVNNPYSTTVHSGSALEVIGDDGSINFYRYDGGLYVKTGGILQPMVDGDGLLAIKAWSAGVRKCAVLEENSLLNPGFSTGVTPYKGTWTVLDTTDNASGWLQDDGLKFAPGVDTKEWSFRVFDADSDGDNDTVEVTYVPEPATMALLGIGGLGVLLRRRRK